MLSKTKLHAMGYRPHLGHYFKTRRCRVRPENKVTVGVRLREHGWYDVTSTERGQTDSSVLLKGVRQLRQWEAFAFCR